MSALRLSPQTAPLFLMCTIPFSFASSYALAETIGVDSPRPSQTDFGGVGLMQMPTGRMAKEGEFNFGVNYNEDYLHYYTTLQLMPWFETTLRYTRVLDVLFNSNEDYSGDNLYTDKGIDFKIKLLEESYWIPETSIGVRDFGGTGLFDGEYIAASKNFGALDVTLGLGWGYFGESGNITNPFCKVSDKYCERDDSFKGNGGSVDFERWFKGPAAIFGGIEYQTPHQPLRFKLEYDSNDYSGDFPTQESDKNPDPKSMTQHTPWNVGVLYQLGDWADLKVSYQRGDTLTLGMNLYTNFNDLSATWRDNPKEKLEPQTMTKRSLDNSSWQSVSDKLKTNAGYTKNTVARKDDTVIVHGEQTKYRDREEALDRAAVIVANATASEEVTTLVVVETSRGVQVKEHHIDLSKYRQAANHEYINAKVTDAILEQESSASRGTLMAENYKKWNAGLSPVLQQSVGGPESFYFYNVGVNADANYWLTNQLEVSGSIYFNISDNYDKFNYVENDPHINNFAVPRVRTLIRSYVHDNPVRLNHLQLTWFAQPSNDIYTQAYGGYLESMFAGFGGEVLYRPNNKPWAIGADLNLISQRDPDSWFGVYDESYVYYDGYDASNCAPGQVSCQAYVLDRGTTGQLTGYYMPQWDWLEGTLFKVSAGEFLAGDIGTRVEFSKQFRSGVIAGAYATFTDLTADEYGEGSYNKGFYVSIPFDLLTVRPSTSRGVIGWQPITRDGGQVLSRKHRLFSVTDQRSAWFQRPNTSN